MTNPRNQSPSQSWYDRFGVYLVIVAFFLLALAVTVWAGGFDSSLCLRPIC